MRILTLTLNPSIDHILTVEEISLQSKNILQGKDTFYGGKGINTAFALGKLDIPTTAVGLVGEKEIHGFQGKLAAANVCARFIPVKGTSRCTYKVMETSTSSDTEFNQPGISIQADDVDQLINLISSLLDTHQWLVMCGSVPDGVQESVYADLINTARMKSVASFLDTSGEALLKGTQAGPDILRINRSELVELIPNLNSSKPDIHRAMKSLHQSGIGIIIVSFSGGAFGFDGQELWQISVPEVNIHSLTGAGDAMTAGFVASQLQKKTFAESLRFSCALATASTLCLDPGDFNQWDLDEIIQKTRIEKIEV